MPPIAMPRTQSASRPVEQRDKEKIPRILLRAIAFVVVATTAMVAVARITGAPPAALPPDVPIAEQRVIHLFGDMSGAARVLDQHGQVIVTFGPGEGGFISGVARSLSRVRDQAGVDPGAPVRLVRFDDGRLALRDDITGWRAELVGFGRDNLAAFARLLEK